MFVRNSLISLLFLAPIKNRVMGVSLFKSYYDVTIALFLQSQLCCRQESAGTCLLLEVDSAAVAAAECSSDIWEDFFEEVVVVVEDPKDPSVLKWQQVMRFEKLEVKIAIDTVVKKVARVHQTPGGVPAVRTGEAPPV